ncbi:MAG: hypothetical protein NVSMB29_18400 [Candidatus Dormibacteria bacterium]
MSLHPAAARLLLSAVGVVGLVACGNNANDCTAGSSCAARSARSSGAQGAASPTATATVAPATATAASAAQPVVVWEAANGSVSYFLDLQGHELGRFVHPPMAAGVAPLATGESSTRFYTISNNLLTFYSAQGTRQNSLPFEGSENFFGPVFTPDDATWLWTTGGLNGGAAHTTRLLVGSAGRAVQRLAERPDPAARQLSPIGWARNLFYLSEQATNGGDQLVFPSMETAWTADPVSGAVRQVAGPDCHLQDVAADGRLLCLDAKQQLLTVRGPSSVTTLRYPGSWDQAGAGKFSADGTRVLIATAAPGPQHRGAYVGPAAGGTMSALPGTYAAFLPDGQILALHDQGGYDLIAPGGARTSVELSGPARAGSFAGVIQHPGG